MGGGEGEKGLTVEVGVSSWRERGSMCVMEGGEGE